MSWRETRWWRLTAKMNGLVMEDSLLTRQSEIPQAKPASTHLCPYALTFVFAPTFAADIGGSLLDAPEVRLLEMAVCRDYYRVHGPGVIGEPPLSYVDKRLCKLDRVQSDRRKPGMLLGLLGQLLSCFWTLFVCYYHQIFPTRLVPGLGRRAPFLYGFGMLS